MTRDEVLAAVAPDPKHPYRLVKVPGGWFGVAGDERWPAANRDEALEWVRLRREDDKKTREIFSRRG